MTERWAGFDVKGEEVVAVVLEVAAQRPYTVSVDSTFRLEDGPKPKAYRTMYHRVRDFLRDGKISVAVLKASAVPPKGRPTLSLLRAAELRGVVAAAMAESGAQSREITRAAVGRQFGERDLDAYLKDDAFWSSATQGKALRVGSRVAATLVVNELESK